MESEERSRVCTEECCALQGSFCGGLTGSFCGGSSIDVKSHMQIFLDTNVDLRHMYEPNIYSCIHMYVHHVSLTNCAGH